MTSRENIRLLERSFAVALLTASAAHGQSTCPVGESSIQSVSPCFEQSHCTGLDPTLPPVDCSRDNTNPGPYLVSSQSRIYYIPVVFHVIHKADLTGKLSEQTIACQVRALNEDFNGIPNGNNGFF